MNDWTGNECRKTQSQHAHEDGAGMHSRAHTRESVFREKGALQCACNIGAHLAQGAAGHKGAAEAVVEAVSGDLVSADGPTETPPKNNQTFDSATHAGATKISLCRRGSRHSLRQMMCHRFAGLAHPLIPRDQLCAALPHARTHRSRISRRRQAMSRKPKPNGRDKQ